MNAEIQEDQDKDLKNAVVAEIIIVEGNVLS